MAVLIWLKSVTGRLDVYKRQFADVIHQVVEDAPEMASVRPDECAFFRNVDDRLQMIRLEAFRVFAADLADDLAAVSYTHLDVYKRQGIRCVGSESAGGGKRHQNSAGCRNRCV